MYDNTASIRNEVTGLRKDVAHLREERDKLREERDELLKENKKLRKELVRRAIFFGLLLLLLFFQRCPGGLLLSSLLARADAFAHQFVADISAKRENFIVVWAVFGDDFVDWRSAVNALADFLQMAFRVAPRAALSNPVKLTDCVLLDKGRRGIIAALQINRTDHCFVSIG